LQRWLNLHTILASMFEIRHFPLLSQTPLALTIGNFDGVHLGHQKMLEVLCEGAAERKLLPAVLTFEPHPREVLYPEKKPIRLITFAQKMRLLQERDRACVRGAFYKGTGHALTRSICRCAV